MILPKVLGYEGRYNDLVFCGSEGQQHVVFFPGDVQVRSTIHFILQLTTVNYASDLLDHMYRYVLYML